MAANDRSGELYRDRWITCTTKDLVIGGYYPPFGIRKRIPYRRIVAVQSVDIGPMTGKLRIWGTSRLDRWAHLDPGRPSKTTALLIDVGRFVKPLISPEDPGKVKQIIDEHTSPDSSGG
jgi:hypothetical protein